MKTCNEEVWKQIPGYNDKYEVSNLGRVRNTETGHVLSSLKSGQGYRSVWLYDLTLKTNRKRWIVLVHRLVAEAFVPNPRGFTEINHKDEDKTNNAANNLEWCDRKYNCNYGTLQVRRSAKAKIPVLQYDKTGVFLKEWASPVDAMRALNIDRTSIYKCCAGKLRSAGGFIWQYRSDNTR